MISYRFMTRGEERQVFGLVESVFNEYVRNDFSLEGIEEFFRAARHMIFDWPSDHFIIVAAVRDKITGMIAMKENRRISLFFVDSSYRRRGIGRTLLHHALAHCAGHASGVNEFEVHSSLMRYRSTRNSALNRRKRNK